MQKGNRPETSIIVNYISKNWISNTIFLSIWAICTIFSFQNPSFLHSIDQSVRDHFFRLDASNTPDDRIAIIDLDELSLERISPWPWDRSKIADLIEKILLDESAASVGLDIIFPRTADEQGDARLAALGKISPVTFAYALDYIPREQPLSTGVLPNLNVDNLHYKYNKIPNATGYISNNAILQNVRCAGNIGYIPDNDGVVRSIPLTSEYNGKYFPTLSLALLICAGVEYAENISDTSLWRLPYSKSSHSFITISAADFLEGKSPKNILQNRHVLVGSSSLALGDHVSTPLSPLAPGVFVHAAALSALLDFYSGITYPSNYTPWLPIAWIGLTFFLINLMLRRSTPLINSFFVIVFAASWMLIAYTNITFFHIEHSIIIPLFGYAFILILIFPLEWWSARRKASALQSVFSHYVGKPVLDELIRRDLKNSLEPNLREITVLVVDMQGYTQHIMDSTLEEAAKFTRKYLEVLTEPILISKGTLDKYTGDGLIAFWGAPLENKNHAESAVFCAISMLDNMKKNATDLYSSPATPIRIRIGIESGVALVGDLGTGFRSSYTAVGDCINVASRLENLAKHLSVQILIGENASKMLKKNSLTSLGKFPIRDTSSEIEVFTLH